MTDPNSIFKPGFYRPASPDGFTDEERRMAQKLVQGDNLERLQRASKTGRRFRPVPVVVTYEYWWVEWGYGAIQCRIERIENGKRSDHRWDGDERTAEQEIARLRKEGFTVREVHMGAAPRKKEQKRTSGRAFILNRLKGFKP